MTPEEISKQANKERQKIEKLHQPKPVKKEKKQNTYNAFSFHTYAKIYPGQMNFMLWFLICVPATVFLCLYFFDDETGKWSLYTALVLYAVFIIRWIADRIMKLSTYSKYKDFPSELGFQLEGWDTLGSYPDQLKNRYWSECTTLEVHVMDHTTGDVRKLINDALFLFMSNANKSFYEAEIGGDGRHKWKQKHLRLEGSSNTAVIGHMYTLLTEYLKSIQSRYHVITKVKIVFDPEIFEVNPPSSD